MIIKEFEDLEIWKEARALSNIIYRLTSKKPFCNDYRFRDQIRASAGSVMDNISEGFGRGGNREFLQFLSVAKGSCCELKSQVYRARDWEYIPEDDFNEIIVKVRSICGKMTSLMNHLKSSPVKGSKYN